MTEQYCIPWKHAERDAAKAAGFADIAEYRTKLDQLHVLVRDSGDNVSWSQAAEMLRNACMEDELALRAVCMQLLSVVRQLRERNK